MTNDRTIDRNALVDVLESHSVSLAVLFGSVVTGDRHPKSDIDIAVEFDDSSDDTLDERLSLIADLSVALDTNGIDLAVIDELDPHVGKRVFHEGEHLIGSEERFEELQRCFDRQARQDDRDPPGERFDAALDRIERLIGG